MENVKILTNTEQFYVKFLSISEYILYLPVSKPFHKYLEFLSEYKYKYNNQLIFSASQVQALMDNAIISTINTDSFQYKLSFESIQKSNDYYIIKNERSILSKISLFMIYQFMCNFCVLYSYLVQDSESKFVEKLSRKGVSKSKLWISWAIVYGIMVFINSLIASIFFEIHYITDINTFIIYFSIMFIFGMSCCSLAFILCYFINDSKMSITVSKHVILSFLGMYYLYYYMTKENNYIIIFLSSNFLFPFSYINLLNSFQALQEKNIIISIDNIINNSDSYQCVTQFLISSLLVCTISLYFIFNKRNDAPIHNNESPSIKIGGKDNILTWEDVFNENDQKIINNQNSLSNNPIVNINFNNFSFIHQIIAVMKLKLSSFVNNEKHFVLNILIPICVINLLLLYFKFIYKEIFDSNYYKSIDLNLNLYSKTNLNWFKDVSSTSETSLKIIDSINDNISLKLMDFSNLDSENQHKEMEINYIAGFKGENIDDSTQLKIYYNNSLLYSLPLAVNILDNAILNHLNVNKKITVTYQPFEKQLFTEYFDEEDNGCWIKINYEITKIIFMTTIMSIIFIYISYFASSFGFLTIADRKSNLTSKLFEKGLKPLNYWIGSLISDSIYMMIPTITIIITGKRFFENGPFDSNYIELSISLSYLWIIQNLLYHYTLCYYFKNHPIISKILFFINGIFVLYLSMKFNVLSVISPHNNNNNGYNIYSSLLNYVKTYKLNITVLLKFIITSVVSPSLGILLILPDWFVNTINKLVLFKKVDIDKFLNSQNVKTILNEDILLVEKKALITETFFNGRKILSLNDLFVLKNLLLGLIVAITIQTVLFFFIEKRKLKKINNEKKKNK
ncbi:hypothetical protein PIROE2DRAFT_7180 [Piromyces sp. E2]|nr:hypothetical protein PIROE2DRAFT_7180 [Piromyces sp. E2]|eukprot:OUM65763.1 hypothetical protein PIROE2DRAFT_7180 [Piromyces sp. E2]